MAIAQYEGPARPAPAIDPRARDVTGTRQDGISFMLTLSCGHVVTRRIMVGAVPKRAICGECPAVGGISMQASEAPPVERFEWTEVNIERLTRYWADPELSATHVAELMGNPSRMSIIGKAHSLQLGPKPGKAARAGKRTLPRQDGDHRRFVGTTARKWRHRELAAGHPAIKESRTRFPTRIVSASAAKHVLVSGVNSRKIGRRVEKGAWKGMPIYTLTLQERATCPRTCQQWTSCYGNNMNWALRIRVDEEDFAIHLSSELLRLNTKHPNGFVVRLHVLGDFFSVGYVDFWRQALESLPALHVLGYTARPLDTPIGGAIWDIVRQHWDRFAIRWSDRGSLMAASEVVQEEDEAQGIICPAERDENRSCGTCGLCWASKKGASMVPAVPLITFLRH